MHRLFAILLATSCLVAPALAQTAEPFGQEKVETRPLRNPGAAGAAQATSGHHHDHGKAGHAHGKAGHRHGTEGKATGRHRHSHRHGSHAGHAHASAHGSNHAHRHHAAGAHDHAQHKPGQPAHGHGGHAHGGHEGVGTENLFGFTMGSDNEEPGKGHVAIEIVGRFGKLAGYTGISKKLEVHYGLTERLSVAGGLFAAYNDIFDFPAAGDRASGLLFNGASFELRYSLIDRKTGPFGLTINVENGYGLSDDLTGKRGSRWGTEVKLIADKEIVHNSLFGAVNLIYANSHFYESGGVAWERGSLFGVAAAMTYQVAPGFFMGGEMRYLRAYTGLAGETFRGDALFLGPTIYVDRDPYWLSASLNVQIAGRDTTGIGGNLNLNDFERIHARLRMGRDF